MDIPTEEKVSLKKGIKYISLHGALGYFTAAKRYMLGLIHSGIPLTWTPMVPGDDWGMNLHPFTERRIGDPDLDSYCNRPVEYDTVIAHTPPEFYPMWRKREAGKRLIGYTVWETDQIPPHWPPLLNMADQLLLPCHWNKSVFRRCNVLVPIDVIPHIADVHEPTAQDTVFNIDPETFVFYTIGTWTARKGIQQTIQCYLDAFTAEDSTLLVIKTTKTGYQQSVLTRLHRTQKLYHLLRSSLKLPNYFKFRADADVLIQNILRKSNRPPRIKLISDELSEDAIRDLHRRGDCFVSLCHSEGWGLGAFDAAARGKPVIITGYGGQLDYLDPALSHLVDYDLVPVRDDHDSKNFRKEQQWAEPKISVASQFMRRVYQNPAEAREKARVLQHRIHERFGEEAVMKRLLAALGKS